MSACKEEPCRSAIEAYRDKAGRAATLAFELSIRCKLLKMARSQLRDGFRLWIVLFALAVACTALGVLPEPACAVLWALAGLAAAWIFMLYAFIVAFSRDVRRRQIRCINARGEALLARIDLLIACPPECWPPEFEIDCDCD